MEHKISIIIPAYNIEKYICTTLDSVLAQTHSNLEVIVVNDGSRDATAALIDGYADKDRRVKAIHKENGGVTSARLRGVAEASGEWIGFVDGDDYVEPQMFERLLENALAHSADISHCGYQMVFPNGRVDYYHNTGRLVRQDGIQGCRDLLSSSFVEPALVNKLYRRELFSGLATWMDQSIRINEDLLMNYYLFLRAKASVFEDVCPYHYVLRRGSAATSRLNSHKLEDPLRVTHLIMEDAPKELHDVIIPKLTRQLVSGATRELGDQADLILPYRRAARKELRRRLGGILTGSSSLKLKMMALWAAVWPASYCWIHRIYAHVSGIDKKYSIE